MKKEEHVDFLFGLLNSDNYETRACIAREVNCPIDILKKLFNDHC